MRSPGPGRGHDVSAPLERPNAVDGHGRKTGEWAEPDSHGGLMVGTYVDGERHGTWRHFSAGGALRSEGGYDRGVLHGPWTWYRATGGLLQRGGFAHGDKHGYWERWTAAGTLVDSGHWEHGRKTGEWTYYDTDGSIRKTTTHRPRPPRG